MRSSRYVVTRHSAVQVWGGGFIPPVCESQGLRWGRRAARPLNPQDVKAAPRTSGSVRKAGGRWPVAAAGGTRRALPQPPPTQHAHSHTRCCPRRPTEDTARVCRAEAAAPALALDPSAPDLASNTQEGNFRNSRESRMCPRQDPTSSKPNFKATGETLHEIAQECRFWGTGQPPGRARGAVLRRPTRHQASPSRLLIALRPRVRPCTTR